MKPSRIHPEQASTRPHIMLFDLYATGHHPQYMLNLVEFWAEQSVECRLTVVAPGEMAETSDMLASLFHQYRGRGLQLISSGRSLAAPSSMLGMVMIDRTHGRVLRHHVETLRPDHVALMYFDHVQLSLALRLRRGYSATLSGIYFRPSFHLIEQSAGIKSRLTAYRKKTILLQAVRNPKFRHLFCLDPFVVPALERMAPEVQAVHLPDGVRIHADSTGPSDVRAAWSVTQGRFVALLLGVLDSRKGVHRILQAVGLLEPEIQRQLAIILAGPVKPTDEASLDNAIAGVREQTEVHVHLDKRYVPDDEVQTLVEASDAVLVLYQRDHVGSSNMLIRAAVGGVPVLGTDHGLIGKLIRENRLGDTVDSTDPDAIARALKRLVISKKPSGFETETAVRFGRNNSATRMGEVFFSSVLRGL